jgi:predicted nuclease with TOPRIM domain
MRDVRAELASVRTELNETIALVTEARARQSKGRAEWLSIRDRINKLPDRSGVEDIAVRAAHWLEKLEWELALLDSRLAKLEWHRAELAETFRLLTIMSN